MADSSITKLKKFFRSHWIFLAGSLALIFLLVWAICSPFDVLDDVENSLHKLRITHRAEMRAEVLESGGRTNAGALLTASRAPGAKQGEKTKSEALFRNGVTAIDENQLNTAIQLLTKSIEIFDYKHPDLQRADATADVQLGWRHGCRAFCFLKQGNYQAGIDDLTKAIKLDPTYKENYINRAKAYSHIGRADLSAADSAKAASLPSN